MSKIGRIVLYSLMIGIGLLAMYSILNAGRSDSLLRWVLPSPSSDVFVAAGSSFAVFVLGFVVFYSRDREGFRHLIELNGQKIRSMREKGISDPEIADSILAAMGSQSGYRHNLARKKLILYLSEYR